MHKQAPDNTPYLNTPFIDRWGQPSYPTTASIIILRRGVFACCVHEGHILLILPAYAPDVFELPGGGIDAGEDLLTAQAREFTEETGLTQTFNSASVTDQFQQDVYFYANDSDEYWVYHQTFHLHTQNQAPYFFSHPRPTPEDGTLQWVKLTDLPQASMHEMHKKALQHFGLLAKGQG